MPTTKAVGIARQSRGDEASKSVVEQESRIRDYCKREGWKLTAVHAEQDVSGGSPLAKRPGLSAAVEAIEKGDASVLVVAYFDRLVRSLKVQAEVVERVEAAGGKVLALDTGEISDATAGSWLSAGMLGMVAEYHRRTTSERVKAAHARLAAEGKWRGGKVPLGLALDADNVLMADGATALFVLEAFKRRAGGATFEQIRAYLREATGLPFKSLIIVTRLLSNEAYTKHGVVDGTLFRRVQDLHAPRGKRPSSDRLLARLEVLRCGSCNSRMVVHGSEPNKTYRCGGQDCKRKMAISVGIAEATVAGAVSKAIADLEGKTGENTAELEALAARKGAALAGLVMQLDGFEDVAGVRERIAVAQGECDAAEDELAKAREAAGFTMHGGIAMLEMPLERRRELIRAVVDSAVVGAGRGETRIAVTLSASFAFEPILDAEARDFAPVALAWAAESAADRADLQSIVAKVA